MGWDGMLDGGWCRCKQQEAAVVVPVVVYAVLQLARWDTNGVVSVVSQSVCLQQWATPSPWDTGCCLSGCPSVVQL